SIEPTADGWIGFCLFTPQQWSDFALLIERPDLASDPALHHMAARYARADEIRAIVRPYTRRHTTSELLERAELLPVPAAPIGHAPSLPASRLRGAAAWAPPPPRPRRLRAHPGRGVPPPAPPLRVEGRPAPPLRAGAGARGARGRAAPAALERHPAPVRARRAGSAAARGG